jgi:hypothetical protein
VVNGADVEIPDGDGDGAGRYTSLAVLFCISPIPIILFSSLFISITRICASRGILCDISFGVP